MHRRIIGAVGLALVARRTPTGRPPTLITYAVIVSSKLPIDGGAAANEIGAALTDPRSWQPIKHVQFLVASAKTARLRIHILAPRDVDRRCAPFPTNGKTSCSRNWDVYLNSDRWLTGAPAAQMTLNDYHVYMANHEVGHSLGEDHRACRGPGQRAPVMLPQTKGLDGCTPNPWPNPGAVLPAVPLESVPSTP
jgi:hypothetical protein